MSMIALVQAGLILGKCFGLFEWSWFEVFAPSVIYLGIGFLVGLIEAYEELSKKSSGSRVLPEARIALRVFRTPKIV